MIERKTNDTVDVERMYWDAERQSTFTTVERIPLDHIEAWKAATSREHADA